MDAPSDLVELGRVVAAYGVKGWVKVQPHSAQGEVLLSAEQWWLVRQAGKPAAYQVEKSRPQGSTVVAQLAGVADRDQAEALRGHVVLASRSAFPQTGEGEYYWVDLIGCDVYSDAHGEPALLGRVDDVFDNGAHAVLSVQSRKQDAKGKPVEVLIPFVDAHIPRVDLAARRIDSNWPLDDE